MATSIQQKASEQNDPTVDTHVARRIKRGTLANVLRQIIIIGSEVALVPILLTYWGAGLYGEWQVLSAAVIYITVLDLGTHTYAINRLNQCYATGQIDELRKNLHTALVVALVTGTLGLMFMFSVAVFVPVNQWFNLKETSELTTRLVLFVLAIHAALALPIAVISGVYRAVGEYARDVMINNVYRTATCVFTALVAVLGGGILEVAEVTLFCFASALAFILWDLHRRYPQLAIGVRQFDRKLMMTFIVPSLLFFFIQASATAIVQGAVLIVAAAAGAAAVAVFTTLRTLVNGIPQVVNSISGTLWPELTALEAKGEYRRLADLHQLSAKIILWLGICAGVFLHFGARDIVKLWTGSRITFDQSLIDGLLVLEVLITWSLASQTLLAAANRPRILAICQLVGSSAGLGLGYILAQSWGSPGVAWGLVAGYLATTSWIIPFAACQMVRCSMRSFLLHVLGRGLIVLAVLLAFVGYVQPMLPFQGGIVGVFFIWLATGVVGLAMLITVLTSAGERKTLRSLMPRQIRWPLKLRRQSRRRSADLDFESA